MLPSASIVARDASVGDEEATEGRKKEVTQCCPSFEKSQASASSVLKQGLDAETWKTYLLLKGCVSYLQDRIHLSVILPALIQY